MDNNDSHVISVAPDALVFIDGKDSINVCQECSCGLKLRDVITNISVDLSTTNCPGNASISMANPQHVDIPLIYKTESVFHAMQEVEIYIKSYFKYGNKDEYAYYPVFWGFVTGVNESYSDGVYHVSLSCKDILRWWEISRVNVAPSVSFVQNFVQSFLPGFKDTETSVYHKIYSGKSIPQIIFELSKITVNELLDISNINALYAATQDDKITIQQNNVNKNLTLMDYWKKRFLQIGRNLKIYGYNGQIIPDYNSEAIKKQLQENFENPSGWKGLESDIPDPEYSLGIDGPEITQIIPAGLVASHVDGINSDYESKLDIAHTVKDVIQYEFYMDVTGEIIFKPPFYNTDVRSNPIHVIKDEEIISWGFSEDESGVVTRVDVAGAWSNYDQASATNTAQWGFFVDYHLAEQYGLRVRSYSLNWLRTPGQCQIYAQSEISRLNALLKSGTIEIIGRSELRLGYPVYIESRDAFYYVTGLQHSFSFGSNFTTSLTLTAERAKVLNDDGIPNKDLALIFGENTTVNSIVNQGVEYAKQIVNDNPGITPEELTVSLKLQIPTFTDLEIYYVLNEMKASNPLELSESNNALLRMSNDCSGFVPTHFRTTTFDSPPFLGNQGKDSYYYINKKLTFAAAADYLIGTQITDSEGYNLIGVFPFGKNLTVLPTSEITPKSLQQVESYASSKLANLAFNAKPTEQAKETVVPSDNISPVMNGVGSMLAQDGVQNQGTLAYNMSVRSLDSACKCDCHKKYTLSRSNAPNLISLPSLRDIGSAVGSFFNRPAAPISVEQTDVASLQTKEVVPPVNIDQTPATVSTNDIPVVPVQKTAAEITNNVQAKTTTDSSATNTTNAQAVANTNAANDISSVSNRLSEALDLQEHGTTADQLASLIKADILNLEQKTGKKYVIVTLTASGYTLKEKK